MSELCKRDLCSRCTMRNNGCEGCSESGGHPCAGSCVAADCVLKYGFDSMLSEIETICNEINSLGIDGLSVSSLNLLSGSFVNLEYPLPNGNSVRFLDEKKTYWGNQIEREGLDSCYGVVADENFILVCSYGEGGKNPEIILYKKR